MSDDEFQCRAINDYYASVTDELDLKEGQIYTIMQTSPSGWWYAVNEDGEDGWVPSNYLERLDGADADGDADADADTSASAAANDATDEQEAEPQQLEEVQPQQNDSSAPVEQQQQQQQPQPQSAAQQVVVQPAQYQGISDGAPDKPITEWNATETLGYLVHVTGMKQRNDFKLTQACRYLTQLATDNDQCVEILQHGGLDVVFGIMQDTAGDVAIQMSTCAAIVVICANPASKQFPAKVNGIFQISASLKENQNYHPFVVLAFNAVCNFCHDHNIHRSMTLETDIVDQIIAGMDLHRERDEGFRVHQAGCLALRNIAADPKGQAAVGPEGVRAITDGLNAYRSMREVVEGSMGVLCNLCALPANGEGFVMGGGLGLLDALYSDVELGDNVRLAAASVLHNLAANPDTALLLSSDEGIDLLVKIIRKAPIESPLFLNTLKVLAALLFKLPDDNKPAGNTKPEVMKRIIDKGLLATLNEAVKYDSKELQEMSVTLMIVIAQTSPKLANALANADCPAQLVSMCMGHPTPQAQHCSVAIWFHVCDAFQNQARLIENGVIEFLTSDWYLRPDTKEDTLRIGCGVFIKLSSNVRNAAAFGQYKEKVTEFCDWCRANKPQLADLCNAIDSSLRQMDPMANAQMHVQEQYSKQPNPNASQQQQQQAEAEPEPEPEPQPAIVKTAEKAAQVNNSNNNGNYDAQVNEPTVVESGGSTHVQENPEPSIAMSGDGHTLAEVKKMKVSNKEAYMSDVEFKKEFKMNKEEFYALRPWKQRNLKKAKGLF